MSKQTNEDTKWLEQSTALIRFSKAEMQNLIVALVMSEKSAEIMDNFDYAKSFKNLREDIIKLAEKALKDCFKIKPAPGLKFLYKVPIGQLVRCSNSKAILVECNDTSCLVVVTSRENREEDSYYSGRHRWAPLTEVEVLG